MTLYDRIGRLVVDETREGFNNHNYAGYLWWWSKGEFTDQEVIDGMKMTSTEEVGFFEMKTAFGNIPPGKRNEWHADVESAGMLFETRQIDEAKYKAILGI